MIVLHTITDVVAYLAPIAYLIAAAVSVVLMRPPGRRWQVVMDEFRASGLPADGRNALRLLALGLVLTLFLLPIVRPDVFDDAPSEDDEDSEVAS